MNPILIDFPQRIECDRLYIRPCLPGDGKVVLEAIQASQTELKRWLPFVQKVQTIDEIEKNIRESHAEFILKEDIRLHVFLQEDDTFIGSIGLHRIDWNVPKFEIGYWVDSRFSKLGYITEAARVLTTFAFNELKAKRVEVRCDPQNLASRRIPEKLGFTLEGILKNDAVSADGLTIRDTCLFAKIK